MPDKKISQFNPSALANADVAAVDVVSGLNVKLNFEAVSQALIIKRVRNS